MDDATPIDLYVSLELVILHELMHTKAGGQAKDYPSQITGLGTVGFEYAISIGSLAYDNAESLAFMGIIGKLIQLGFSVDALGNLHPILAPLVRRDITPGRRSLVNGSRFVIDERPSSALVVSLQ